MFHAKGCAARAFTQVRGAGKTGPGAAGAAAEAEVLPGVVPRWGGQGDAGALGVDGVSRQGGPQPGELVRARHDASLGDAARKPENQGQVECTTGEGKTTKRGRATSRAPNSQEQVLDVPLRCGASVCGGVRAAGGRGVHFHQRPLPPSQGTEEGTQEQAADVPGAGSAARSCHHEGAQTGPCQRAARKEGCQPQDPETRSA
mmetsp:Transcript_1798/g.2539  ORF Transcript_1798/g.2539 Transcript_1798/m.2539 type:complete len:202 (-) Transcript_1798:2013-2618(-)